MGKWHKKKRTYWKVLTKTDNLFSIKVKNAPARYICWLGFCFFVPFVAFPQNSSPIEQEIKEGLEQTISTYYYTNLDSALDHFGQLAEKAREHQLWLSYLEIVTNMAWCANQHKNIDTLPYFLQLGETVAHDHQAALDTLDPDNISRSNLIYTRGMYYYSAGDFEEAIGTFKRIVMPDGVPIPVDSLLAFDTYSSIGNAYYRLENYEQAMVFQQIAAHWLPATSDSYPSVYEHGYQQALNQFYIGKCNMALAEYGLNQSSYQQAKLLFQKSLDTLLSQPKDIANKNAIISQLNALGQVYENQENYDSSLYFLKKSLTFHLPNDAELLNTYNYLGDVYLRKGDYQNALVYYHKRLALVDQKFTGKYYQKAISLYKIGSVFARQHLPDEALNYYQQAIIRLVTDFNTKDILVNPPLQAPGSEKELLEALLLKAEALYEIYNQHPEKNDHLIGAMDTYHMVVDLVDKMRQKFSSIEYKQFLSAKALSIYEQALQLAWEAYQRKGQNEKYLSEAFFIAEKGKSASLLEAVKNAAAKEFAGIPKALLEEENNLKRKLAYWEKRLYESSSKDEGVEQIRENIFALEQAHQNFVANLEENWK